MTNEEIFQAAMEKARMNGYDGTGSKGVRLPIDTITFIIFSHDFAKAFWKDEEDQMFDEGWVKGWQYHLAYMALEEDPIKYLGQFLGKVGK